MCNGHEKSNWQVGAVEEPLPLLHTSGSPGCREGWWHTVAWGWVYLILLPQEILGEKLFLNRWEPSGFGAMKPCSKWQLLGEMAVMGTGRERCWHREAKPCSVSVPSSNQEALKWHLWRCVKYTHTNVLFLSLLFQILCSSSPVTMQKGGSMRDVAYESEIKVRSVCCVLSPKYRFSFRKQIL